VIALTHVPVADMQACERTYIPPAAIDGPRLAEQHRAYCQLLAECGATVRTLDVHRNQPDGVFIEDTAIVLDEVAILCLPGVASRRAEPRGIEPVLREYRAVVPVEWPATLEGGDVLRIDRTLLVGQSSRTNATGIAALTAIAARYGYRVQAIPVCGALHLKTACGALPCGRLLANPEWIDTAALAGYELISIPATEPWGANFTVLGSTILLPAAHQETAELIGALGFSVRMTDLSEFAKAEGGITCLGLLIPQTVSLEGRNSHG
jgi:dimethylargininase